MNGLTRLRVSPSGMACPLTFSVKLCHFTSLWRVSAYLHYMTDGELLRQLVQRSISWKGVLEKLRATHTETLGRSIEVTSWVAGDTLGTWSWYGFYWDPERFWFGYGYHGDTWQPMISADIRTRHAQSWLQLRSQLPTVWSASVGGDFAYLWSSLGDRDPQEQSRWFHDRSMELHEYSLMER